MKQMLFKALMVSGAVLVSAAMAMGQQPQQQSMPQQQQTNPGMQQQQQQQATMQQQQQQSPQMQQMEDRSFVQHAMQGSMGEVQLGQLAEQKSSSQDVKQFAEKMTQDHSQLDEQMKPIAQQLGVKTPEKISKKDGKLDAKLQGLSGSQFDDAYIKAMVKQHKDDLSDFQHEAQATQNPQLKQAAEQCAQLIEQHLAMIKQIAKDHGVKG